MDKVKTAVKCAGVAAAYLLLLMFSKLLEFWIFTSFIYKEDLLGPQTKQSAAGKRSSRA